MDISQSTPIAGSRLVTVSGELDADNCGALAQPVLDDLDGVAAVSLDLSAVSFIDSSALSELLRVRGVLAENDIALTVTDASEQVRRVLEITGLSDTFGISNTPG